MVTITDKVAFEIIKTAAKLFKDLYGFSLDPDDPTLLPEGDSIITYVNSDELGGWVNDIAHFLRLVHGILQFNTLIQEDG